MLKVVEGVNDRWSPMIGGRFHKEKFGILEKVARGGLLQKVVTWGGLTVFQSPITYTRILLRNEHNKLL